MNRTPLTKVVASAAAATLVLISPGRSAVAGGGLGLGWGGGLFHPGYHYQQVSVVRSGGTASGLTLIPVSTVPAATATTTTTTNGLHLIPINSVTSSVATTNQSLQLIPINGTSVGTANPLTNGLLYYQPASTQSAQANPLTNGLLYYQPASAQTGQSGQMVIPSNSFQADPERAAASASGVGGNSGPTDEDMNVLASGFGNRLSRVDGLRDFLKKELTAIEKKFGKQLTSEQLTKLLLVSAESFLPLNGFGFLINEPVEKALRRVIGQIIQDRTPSPNERNTSGQDQVPPIPTEGGTGGGIFKITGTIILSPAGGDTAPPKRPITQPTEPATQPQPDEPTRPATTDRPQGNESTQPANLIIDGDVTPARPPSR